MKQETTAGPATEAAPNLIPDQGRKAVEEWLASNEFMMKSAFGMAQRMMDFTQSRLREDLDTMKTLAGCRKLEDVAACQRSFAEKATKQYAAQLNGMAKDMTTAFGDFFDHVRH